MEKLKRQIARRWQISPRLPADIDNNLQAYHPVLRQILFNRGFATIESASLYLEAVTPQGTEPLGITGMQAAVERLDFAIQKGERIAVYGDYDVDGVTGTALLGLLLNSLGAQAMSYIPNRFDEGYGLNNDALTYLHSLGIKVVITVDCGIRSVKEAEHARNLGIDMIITDHHHPGEQLPWAIAILNPKQPGDLYPEKELAGVGLAYKLATALLDYLKIHHYDMPVGLSTTNYLDLVALGTIADMVPLVGENRALVRSGLMALRKSARQGIHSLIHSAGLLPTRVTADRVGFILAPRLNAAGRLESALASLELLTTLDPLVSGILAQKLDDQNRERQKITRQIQSQAEQLAFAEDPDPLLLFAAHPDFNPGVVGLAAMRLTEQYYRPTVIAHLGEEYTRGSCRSIAEFHITNALDQCEDLLEHHGGHAAAAGFTVRNDNLPELRSRLQTLAELELSSFDLRPTSYADMEIQLTELKPELLSYLEWLQPTGYGNPSATFVARSLVVKNAKTVGNEGTHLKMTVSDGWLTFDGIAFNQGYWLDELTKYIDVMFHFEMNEYNGQNRLQLNVLDLKPAMR